LNVTSASVFEGEQTSIHRSAYSIGACELFLLLLSESLRVLIGNKVLGVDITLYGLLLVVFIIYMPKGILGTVLQRVAPGSGAAAK
jgi:ABC-type branched-subunit amino acid transport system permease subunit